MHRFFFDAKINVDDRPYNTKECPSFIVSEEYLEKNFELIESPVEIETKNESVIEKPDPRVRAALWQDYKYGMIYIPKQHSEMLNELREMLESPVLPSRCAKFIEEFIEAIQENTHKVASVLTECANELPQKLSTIKKLRKISLAWISNKYVDEFTELKPKADQIIESIRTHWAIDELTLKK